MAEQLTNLVQTTLDGAHDDTTTTLTVADGSAMPATGTFRINVDPEGADEICEVTARSGNDLTVVRGSEGTTAASHASGVDVAVVLTAAALAASIAEGVVHDHDSDYVALGSGADEPIGNDAEYFSAVTQTTYLRPSTDVGYSGSASPVGSPTRPECIDEASVTTGDYVSSGGTGSFWFGLDSSTLPAGSVIERVRVFSSKEAPAANFGGSVQFRLPDGSLSATVESWGQNPTRDTNSGWYATSPFTGLAWTEDEIRTLQIRYNHGSLGSQKVFTSWLEVEYSAPVSIDEAIETLAADKSETTHDHDADYSAAAHAHALGDASDADLGAIANGDFIRYSTDPVETTVAYVSNGLNGIFNELRDYPGSHTTSPVAVGIPTGSYDPQGPIENEGTLTEDGWHSANTAGSIWKVDLGVGNAIDATHVGMQTRTDNGTYLPDDFVIEGSNDDSNWDVLFTNTTPMTAGSWRAGANAEVGTQYRYFRVRSTGPDTNGGNYLVIANVEIWGTLYEATDPRYVPDDLSGKSDATHDHDADYAAVDHVHAGGSYPAALKVYMHSTFK